VIVRIELVENGLLALGGLALGQWIPLEGSLATLLEMRTLRAGARALRKTPLAAAPLVLEGIVAGFLVLVGAFPAKGLSAPAVAVFPLDIYFDLKQSLAHATAWPWFIAGMALSLTIRPLVLTLTLRLAGTRATLAETWMRAARLGLTAALLLLPAAVFLFVGVGVRYAPFVWVGAILGAIPGFLLIRWSSSWHANEAPGAKPALSGSGFLSYVYVLAAIATAMSLSRRFGVWPPAVLLSLSGPIHVLFLLGWRELSRERTTTRPVWAVVATLAAVAVVFGSAGIDRFVRDGGSPAPPLAGSLALLGGVNSTSSTGALSALDPRRLGFSPSQTTVLSYRRAPRYGEEATHGSLDAVAPVVAALIAKLQRPVDVVGHSQAALIVDRILKRHLVAPDRAVLFASPPPYPPTLTVPTAGHTGPGSVAADIARPLSRVFELFGANGFNIDAPAAPFHLKRVQVSGAATPRLAVWALGDSVWLQDDWRRRGETNIVAITDHVGVTNNPRALNAASDFFHDQRVGGDGSSWRGFAVNLLRYAFEPWRPG
jgi:hypothetical protein